MKKYFIYLLASIVIISTSCKKHKLKTDLIAYYKFDGTVNDESENNHNGIPNGTSFSSDKSGNADKALYLDGSSYLEIPYTKDLDLTKMSFTIAAWIYPERTSGCYIITKEGQLDPNGNLSSGGGPYSLDIFPGTLRAVIYGYDVNTNIILEGKTPIKEKEWQHIAITMSGRSITLYYNGQVETTGSFSGGIQTTNGNVYIGTYKWVHPNAAFKGKIDNVRIYSKPLKSKLIKELYDENE
jgi:hypothetical protein